jgi:hypothetical protein
MSKKQENNNKGQTKTTSFSSLAESQKVSIRLKLSIAQLKQLDEKEEVEVAFKGRKLQLKCLGKAE